MLSSGKLSEGRTKVSDSLLAALSLLAVLVGLPEGELTAISARIEQFRYGGSEGGGGGIDFAVEILVMVAVIPSAIAAWLLVDSTGWGTGAIALWNIGILLIVVFMIYAIWHRASSV